jgi:8-oxo-dGTP diphosphatase
MVRTSTRLYVVRHADAGLRGLGPDDDLRPLSPRGQVRARALADLLEHVSNGAIVSSPAVRCVQTVEPLAARRRGQVALSNDLAEGAAAEQILDLLHSLADASVVCTHGDMLGELARVIGDARDEREDAISFDKGGVWVLSRHGGELALVDQISATSTSIDHRRGTMCRDGRLSDNGHVHSIQPPRRSADHGNQGPIEEEQEASVGRGR